MMSPPSRGLHMPTDGITGWGAAAQRAGEGVAAALAGTGRALEEHARVTTAGELADFSERLRAIDRETRDELAEQDVQDWNYAWQQATGPKLEEALGELSSTARHAGRKLAQEYSARASLEAQRDYELQRIDKARSQWRNRVDEAVRSGDARQAQEWLRAGQGVFVAPGDMEKEEKAANSQARLNRWQGELEQQPLQALCRLTTAGEDELPTRQEDTGRLAQARTRAGRAARQEVMQRLVAYTEDDVAPEPEYVQMAGAAGVLNAKQTAAALQAPKPLSVTERREWLRRIDECPDEAGQADALRLDIATAAIPPAERRGLLRRLEQSGRIPARQRMGLSRRLGELYRSGGLGCPGDDEAQLYYGSLQQETLARLEQDGPEAADRWLNGMNDVSNRWVCFNPQSSIQQI